MTYNNCYLNQLYNDLISNSPQTIALDILKNHPEIEKIEVDEEPMVSLPGLEIFPSRRKVFRDRQEIQLTAKEYRILLLLAANKGRVLTYAQIYEQVWGDFTTGNENNTIGFHICNLREKLYRANPDASFYIRSVREVGYCLEAFTERLE